MLSRLVRSPALYSLGAPWYDRLTHHELQELAFDEISQYLPESGRILDLACGPGRLMERLKYLAPGRSFVGADAAPGALARAKQHGEVVEANIEDLPFPDASFDAAVISGALYLVSDPDRVLSEMARVSRGTVAVLEASPALNIRAAIDPRKRLSPRARLDIAVWSAAMRFTRRMTPEILQGFLSRAPLQDIQVSEAVDGYYLIGTGRVRG